jgi:hypothetical protein
MEEGVKSLFITCQKTELQNLHTFVCSVNFVTLCLVCLNGKHFALVTIQFSLHSVSKDKFVIIFCNFEQFLLNPPFYTTEYFMQYYFTAKYL